MKCTFYRTETVETKKWGKMIQKLRNDLEELKTGKVEEEEVRIYLNQLMHHAKELDRDPRMLFFGFWKPESMESDIRVHYFYWPTYLASSIMMKALMLYPGIMKSKMVSSEKDSYSIEEAKKILSGCLLGCTGRGFYGSGYESLKGQLEVMELFTDLGVISFIRQYPDLCPEFNDCYLNTLRHYKEAVERGALIGDWNQDFTEQGQKVLLTAAEYDDIFLPEYSTVFVYGTLMSGQVRHDMLKDAQFIGHGVLKDYAMYDLGSYPGIVPCTGEDVIGEVYIVNNETLRRMDTYESEGSLYLRKASMISLNDGTERFACFYQYNHEVEGKPIRVRWNMKDEDLVWYAGYGSNLSEERFDCYIRGGICRQNEKTYPGCSDTTKWKDNMIEEYSGEMYFANHSASWQNGGVSFFKPGGFNKTVMRLYLITYGQFKDIQAQEGKSDHWYGRIKYLDAVHGIPVFTLTSEYELERTEPSEKYLLLLKDSLVNEVGYTERKAESYLKRCKNKTRIVRVV